MSAEGVGPAADWSAWERDKPAPQSNDGFGLHIDHRDDLTQFADLGCTDWRVTIEWTRVEPEPGRVDNDALDRYRDMLSCARDIGLRNRLTLQHTSLPGWYLDDEGGHRDAEARQAARAWDDLLWGTWLRAHANGMLEIDGRAAKEVPKLVSGVDAVGLIHDHPVGVDPVGNLGPWPAAARLAADGLAPEPDEPAEAIHRTHEALPDHTLIAWQDHQLARALDHMRAAADCIGLAGYFHDAGIDGYEWKKGFDAPRGLLRRDRSRKPAAETFESHT